MSERTLKQLVGALAIVAGIWAVSLLFTGGDGAIGASGEISELFAGIDAGEVDALRIEGPDGSVSLERGAGGEWTVNGFPGDRDSFARLINILSDLSVGDLVATNPSNHDRMGVSADSATTVTFEVGGASNTVLVGNAGRRFGTAYVRLSDTDEVYLLDGDLRGQVTRRVDQWRDRTMATVDSTAVATIEVEHGDGDYALIRGDSVWTLEGGGETTATTVNGILTELANLVASGFIEEGDSIGAAEQATVTRALSASGEVLAEIVIGAGDGDRWARTMTDDYLYRVSSFRAGRVAPARESVEAGG